MATLVGVRLLMQISTVATVTALPLDNAGGLVCGLVAGLAITI